MMTGGCVLLEASGCCKDLVIEQMAQMSLLLLDCEESFEADLRWGWVRRELSHAVACQIKRQEIRLGPSYQKESACSSSL